MSRKAYTRRNVYWSRSSVCMCVCPSPHVTFPHSHTIARTRMYVEGMVWVSSSCALLGEFAIGAQVSLLWQHSAEREMSCLYSLYDCTGEAMKQVLVGKLLTNVFFCCSFRQKDGSAIPTAVCSICMLQLLQTGTSPRLSDSSPSISWVIVTNACRSTHAHQFSLVVCQATIWRSRDD